ncbi:MAG: regulatory protein RecX [Weeksellaceae bacterium]
MDKETQIRLLLNRAYYYLKFRLRAEAEMRLYLHKKAEKFSIPLPIIDEVIASLKEEKLINDDVFAMAFINDRMRNKPKSHYILKRELQQKGVPDEIIEQQLQQVDLPDEDLARQALQTAWPRFARLDKEIRYKRVLGYLGRRGFNYGTIKNLIEEFEGKQYNRDVTNY